MRLETSTPFGVRELTAKAQTPLGSVGRVIGLLDREALVERGEAGRIERVRRPDVIRRRSAPEAASCVVPLLSVKYSGPMDVRAMARAMGRRGGRARARRLSAARRRQIASLGGRARHRSLLVARRIADNLLYAAAALELRGGQPDLLRMRTFTGRLPGLYPDRS